MHTCRKRRQEGPPAHTCQRRDWRGLKALPSCDRHLAACLEEGSLHSLHACGGGGGGGVQLQLLEFSEKPANFPRLEGRQAGGRGRQGGWAGKKGGVHFRQGEDCTCGGGGGSGKGTCHSLRRKVETSKSNQKPSRIGRKMHACLKHELHHHTHMVCQWLNFSTTNRLPFPSPGGDFGRGGAQWENF